MVDQDRETRETVIIEDDSRPSYGWAIALGVIAFLIILFFAFGGMNWFSGDGNGADTTETIETGAPENINVQPTR